jgi:alpha-beta hydrolase superfamily lysophospholipase
MLFASFGFLNFLAYRHARAFTHYVPAAPSLGNLESLSYLEMAKMSMAGVKLPRPANRYTPRDIGLSYETHEIVLDDVDRLEAWHIGHPVSRGLVLMFHGYSTSKASLLNEARLFHDLGFATLLVDFRGSGGSSGDDTTVGFREADDVAAAVAYARARWSHEMLVLFGHSMGSAAIMRAVSCLGVSADAAILECPFDRLLTTIENRFAIAKLPAFPLARLLVFWGGIQAGFNGFEHNPVEYARSCRCPVLLIHGEDDDKVTRVQAEEIFENLPEAKELRLLPGVGHEALARSRPNDWCLYVSRFLDNQLNQSIASQAGR